MTDTMGLSEPGKTPKPMNQRTAGILALSFLLVSVAYLYLSLTSFQEGEPDLVILVLGFAFLIMATGWFFEWRRSKRFSRDRDSGAQAGDATRSPGGL
ncbi:hypothetical protein IWX64_003041 [Arthrobacter sp. CAN_A212]|uniref:hypothetical protein n=1 Tax=Arthrobacter sp. CAN_A212 TaxID=2787719 RepID=UPI0018CB3C70